jgi:hypothetical protein
MGGDVSLAREEEGEGEPDGPEDEGTDARGAPTGAGPEVLEGAAHAGRRSEG